MKVLLSGNQAMARGAYEGNVAFASSYPGTPATDLLEHVAEYKNIESQWASNEKVALDVAIGYSLGGKRSLVAMKHVGLNVASDTFMTLSYTGINAGLVVVTVDDPGMSSSQNEQDNRNYAKFAKIPLLEPSDSQESKDFIKYAFKISEKFDTPVLIRSTTRIAHTKSIVTIQSREKDVTRKNSFKSNPSKYVMIPLNAKERRTFVEERINKLKSYSESFKGNIIIKRKGKTGIITSGVSYQYCMEGDKDANILKLGMTYPLPEALIRNLGAKYSSISIVEELDPFIEEQVRCMGIKNVKGKECFPSVGELDLDLVKKGLNKKKKDQKREKNREVINRKPELCTGCLYRGFFYILKKLKTIVVGDIGCYSLCVLPPISSLETCISMGSGLGIAQGLKSSSKVKTREKVVAVIGDSTFVHSGIPALINMAYNNSTNTVVILDNGCTAMTGGQNHPGTGVTLAGKKTNKIDYISLIKSLGIKRVKEIDGYNLKECEKIISKELMIDKLSVLIAKLPCILKNNIKKNSFYEVVSSLCTLCERCLELGCPAIYKDNNKKVYIDKKICSGCSFCEQICPSKCIKGGK